MTPGVSYFYVSYWHSLSHTTYQTFTNSNSNQVLMSQVTVENAKSRMRDMQNHFKRTLGKNNRSFNVQESRKIPRAECYREYCIDDVRRGLIKMVQGSSIHLYRGARVEEQDNIFTWKFLVQRLTLTTKSCCLSRKKWLKKFSSLNYQPKAQILILRRMRNLY